MMDEHFFNSIQRRIEQSKHRAPTRWTAGSSRSSSLPLRRPVDMPEEVKGCWAACLGDCSGKLSGEHVVSKSVFIRRNVVVHGLHWCKEAPKKVGLNSITRKILCEGHNSALHPVDSAAGRTFQVLRDSLKLSDRRRESWTVPEVKRFTIEATLLERWLLKTLINLHADRDTLLGINAQTPGHISLDLVELCYGRRLFEGHAGMYVAAHRGMNFVFDDKFSLFTLTNDDGRILGACFVVHGLNLFLNLLSDVPPPPFEKITGLHAPFNQAQLFRPFEKIRVKHLSWTSHFIDFQWDPQPIQA